MTSEPTFAAVTAFAALGKVLSPQFLIWVIPLGALAFAWHMHLLAAATGLATVLTQVEFPARYLDVVEREPPASPLESLTRVWDHVLTWVAPQTWAHEYSPEKSFTKQTAIRFHLPHLAKLKDLELPLENLS